MKFLIRFKHLPVSTDQLYRHIEIDKVVVVSKPPNILLQGQLSPAFQPLITNNQPAVRVGTPWRTLSALPSSTASGG